MKTSEILYRAGDVLRKDGWCKFTRENTYGQHCALGAIAKAEYGSVPAGYKVNVEALNVVMHIDEYGAGFMSYWNDRYVSGVEEVLEAFDAAYVLQLQEEGIEPEDVL